MYVAVVLNINFEFLLGKTSAQIDSGIWILPHIFRVGYRFDTGSLASIGIDIPYTGAGRSVFWSVFWALKNLAGTLKGLAGNPFFLKMGAGPLKKGAVTFFSRKKGVPAKIIIPKCTDRVFLRYRFGKNREIPTEYQPKKPNWYPTLHILDYSKWPQVSQ